VKGIGRIESGVRHGGSGKNYATYNTTFFFFFKILESNHFKQIQSCHRICDARRDGLWYENK
jgi:hypothetical protein